MATATRKYDPAFRADVYEAACRDMRGEGGGAGDYCERQGRAFAVLERLDAEAGAGLRPNRLVNFPAADGYAWYLVARVGERTCLLLHVPCGDAYTSAAVSRSGSCLRATAEGVVTRRDALKALFAEDGRKRAAAARRRRPGDTVYYRGPRGWLRGVALEGGKVRPTAILGEPWRQVDGIRAGGRSPADGYTVSRAGKVTHGYDAARIKAGAADDPRPEEIWGDPACQARIYPPGFDPAGLPEMPIDPPPFTPEQEAEHELWRECEEIASILDTTAEDGMPSPRDRLMVAARLIAAALDR